MSNGIGYFQGARDVLATTITDLRGLMGAATDLGNADSAKRKAFLAAPDVIASLPIKQIQARLSTPPAQMPQIKAEITKFGANVSYISTMKVIDHFICGMVENEETYFEIIAGCQTESDYRKAYFSYLDKAGLFFLVRWVAKIAFFFMFPTINKNLQNGVMTVFTDVSGQVKEKQGDFEAAFNKEIGNNNEQTKQWIAALEKVSQSEGISQEEMVGKLEKELLKPEYHNGLSPTEFYNKMSVELCNRYFPKLKVSQRAFNAFQIQGKAAWWKTALNVLLFPIAGLLYIVFLLPEYAINKMIGHKVRRFLKEHQLLEKLFDHAMRAMTSAAGLSGPMLRSANETLEEVLYEMNAGTGGLDSDRMAELSPKNREVLKENVRLSTIARGMFYQQDPKKDEWIDQKTQEGVAKGLERIVVTTVDRLTNEDYVHETVYKVISAVNKVFQKGPISEEKRQAELKKEQQRFMELVHTIVTVAIKEEVPKYLSVDVFGNRVVAPQNIQDRLSAMIFSSVAQKVEGSIGMLTHPVYLKFMIRNALANTVNDL